MGSRHSQLQQEAKWEDQQSNLKIYYDLILKKN
jgi:hypothetical protein